MLKSYQKNGKNLKKNVINIAKDKIPLFHHLILLAGIQKKIIGQNAVYRINIRVLQKKKFL